MKIGKLQESVLDRSIFKQLHKNQKNILCKPKVGVGYQMIRTEGCDALAMTSNVVEGTAKEVGMLAVPRGINSLVCSGADPVGLMLTLTLPADLEEQELRGMIHAIDAGCTAEGIDLMGGHTQISGSVSRVIAGVTACGLLEKNGTRNQSFARPGQDIVMTKWAGLSGAWLLEHRYHEAFCKKYNPDICDSIDGFKQYFSVRREASLALEYGAHTLYDLSEGGVFGGLWEVAVAGNVGLRVDLKKIPLKQETVELCDFVDVNPYQLPGAGALLIAADHGEALVHKLAQADIPAVIIGCFTDDHDRVIVNDDEVRYLEPPRAEIIL